MRTSSSKPWLGLVALLALSATSALAKPKMNCKDKCKADAVECAPICESKAGAKNAAPCKRACSEGEKRCETNCAKKK